MVRRVDARHPRGGQGRPRLRPRRERLANEGAIDAALFAKNCGEGLLFCAKCQVLKERFPGAWTRTMPEAETFIARSTVAQEKLAMFRKRFA